MSARAEIGIRILSAGEAQNWVHGWPTVVVSIVNPEDAHLVASSPRPDLITRRLFVADVTDPAHAFAATEADVDELIALGREVPDGARILLHCRGGIGRSPAAAIICLVAAGWDPSDARREVSRVRPQARPNGWMLLLADQILTPAQRDGVFSSYVAWAHQQDWWHPLPGTMTADAVAGRLSWDRCIDLVKAQTHKIRGVDLGPHR